MYARNETPHSHSKLTLACGRPCFCLSCYWLNTGSARPYFRSMNFCADTRIITALRNGKCRVSQTIGERALATLLPSSVRHSHHRASPALGILHHTPAGHLPRATVNVFNATHLDVDSEYGMGALTTFGSSSTTVCHHSGNEEKRWPSYREYHLRCLLSSRR